MCIISIFPGFLVCTTNKKFGRFCRWQLAVLGNVLNSIYSFSVDLDIHNKPSEWLETRFRYSN